VSVYTPGQFAEALRVGGREARHALILAGRRGLTKVRRYASQEFRYRGIGRAVFGKKGSGTRPLFRRARVRIEGSSIVGGMELVGLAAIQEVGGRIRQHVIKARPGRALSFLGTFGRSAGRSIAVQKVLHPGATMPRFPVLQKAATRAHPEILADAAQVYADTMKRVLG
jgi:hypothetical protein